MNEIQSFLNMNGYAAYVWSAYGITLIVMVLNVMIPIYQKKLTIKRLHQQIQRQKERNKEHYDTQE